MAVTPLTYDVDADADISDIAALSPADGDMLYWAAGGTRYNATPSTSYMRGLLNTASEAALRTALSLGTSATVNTGTSGATIPLLNGANAWSGAQSMDNNVAFNVKETGGTARSAVKMDASNNMEFGNTNNNAEYLCLSHAFTGTDMFLGGVAIPTISSTSTLTNKTLSSPTLSGTVAGGPTTSGQWTFTNSAEVVVFNRTNFPEYTLKLNDNGTLRGYMGWSSAFAFMSQNASASTVFSVSQAGALQAAGVAVPTISSTDTLSNKTLTSPTLSGTVAGTASFSSSVTAMSATAIPAGGTAGAGVMVSSTANFGVFFGSGAPTLSAAQGSLYMRSDGSSTSTRMYVNTNGSTTWTAVTTAA